jgi:hypothetical protein
MGIRFNCPNGHKLNVKSELAGKKAICPDCGAKLVVPAAGAASESSIHQGSVAGRFGAAEAGESRIIGTVAPAVVLHNSVSAAMQSSGKARSSVVWYIRPVSGGQFGPVNDDELCAWIADGRLTADSYVWRAGWPDWLKAGDAADELPTSLPVTTLTELPVSAASEPPVADVASDFPGTPSGPVAVAAPLDELAVLPITGARRPRRQTPLFVTVLLVLAIIVLAGVLIWVIQRNAGSEPPAPQASRAPLAESQEST